jgi:hypothetical protein
MPQIHAPDEYPASEYDEYWCLKPPPLLWLATLYLSRSITLPLIMAVGTVAGINSSSMGWLKSVWSLNAIVPSLIAAAILYDLFRRVPTASRGVRWTWARGRVFLGVSAAVDLALSAITIVRLANASNEALMAMLCGALDLAFLAYVLLATRVRETFAHFPAPELAEKKPAKRRTSQ